LRPARNPMSAPMPRVTSSLSMSDNALTLCRCGNGHL
jgi:hypothetical protein